MERFKIKIAEYLGYHFCSEQEQIDWLGCKSIEGLNRIDKNLLPIMKLNNGSKYDVIHSSNIDLLLSWETLIKICVDLNIDMIPPSKEKVIEIIYNKITNL